MIVLSTIPKYLNKKRNSSLSFWLIKIVLLMKKDYHFQFQNWRQFTADSPFDNWPELEWNDPSLIAGRLPLPYLEAMRQALIGRVRTQYLISNSPDPDLDDNMKNLIKDALPEYLHTPFYPERVIKGQWTTTQLNPVWGSFLPNPSVGILPSSWQFKEYFPYGLSDMNGPWTDWTKMSQEEYDSWVEGSQSQNTAFYPYTPPIKKYYYTYISNSNFWRSWYNNYPGYIRDIMEFYRRTERQRAFIFYARPGWDFDFKVSCLEVIMTEEEPPLLPWQIWMEPGTGNPREVCNAGPLYEATVMIGDEDHEAWMLRDAPISRSGQGETHTSRLKIEPRVNLHKLNDILEGEVFLLGRVFDSQFNTKENLSSPDYNLNDPIILEYIDPEHEGGAVFSHETSFAPGDFVSLNGPPLVAETWPESRGWFSHGCSIGVRITDPAWPFNMYIPLHEE